MSRIEHDFLGDLEIPDDVYYGVQSLRGKENFHITEHSMNEDEYFIKRRLRGRVVRGLGPALAHHLGEHPGVVQQRARPQHVGVERLPSAAWQTGMP